MCFGFGGSIRCVLVLGAFRCSVRCVFARTIKNTNLDASQGSFRELGVFAQRGGLIQPTSKAERAVRC